jgi:arginase
MVKALKIIENCSEIGAGTRGASLGIDAIKIASLNLESEFFVKTPSVRIQDENHLLFEPVSTPSAIRISGIAKVYERIAEAVEQTIESGQFPLIMAADHASAGGTIAGIKKAHPNKRLGVIWIDAHADLHSPFTSPSGNVHGMPLATALSEDNRESKVVDPSEKALKTWESMKAIGGIEPKLAPEDLIFYGVRDTEKPEEALMKRNDIVNYSVDECRSSGMVSVAEKGLDRLSECDIIYISFDVDSMDPDLVSYGTGTPVKHGFSPQEANDLINALIEKSKKVCCFEMVEVNPILDNQGNKMAETAFGILENISPKLSEYGI